MTLPGYYPATASRLATILARKLSCCAGGAEHAHGDETEVVEEAH